MKFKLFLFIIILITGLFHCAAADEILIVTENWPPYNYEEDGIVKGFSTEVVRSTLEKAGIKATFRLGNWKGVYKLALNNKNILIYTMARIEERENLFKWIGPLAPRKINLYKLKKRDDIVVQSIDDIKKYVVGVMDDDAMHHYFIKNGFVQFKHFNVVRRDDLNFKLLFNNRIDLLTGNDLALAHMMKQKGYHFNQLENIYNIIKEGYYYMAFNKNTDDVIVERMQTAFDTLKKEGIIDRIFQKYLE